jgi:hypothetical protein
VFLVHHSQHVHDEDVVILVLIGVKPLTRVDALQKFLLDSFLLLDWSKLSNIVRFAIIAVD